MSSHEKETKPNRQTNDLPIEDKDVGNSRLPPFHISDDDASSLLSKMVNLGYFHKQQKKVNNNSILHNREERLGDSDKGDDETNNSSRIKEMNECKDRIVQERQQYKLLDDTCSLLFPTSTSISTSTSPNDSSYHCMTRNNLTIKIEKSLRESNGRLSLETISQDFRIPISDVKRSARDLMERCGCHRDGSLHKKSSSSLSSSATEPNIQLVQNELVTSGYFDDICRNQVTNALFESNEGCVLVSDLARDVFRLPFDYSLTVLLDRIIMPTTTTAADSDTECRTDSSTNRRIFWLKGVELIGGSCGGKQLVTAEYQEKRQKEVLDLLSFVTTPTLFKDIVGKIEWDPSLIVHHAKAFCDSKQLKGELHVDLSATHPHTTALYKPHIYTDKQEEMLKGFFASNGYITFEQSSKYGMSQTNMVEYILKSFPRTIRLSNSIIQPDTIAPPIRAAIEECIAVKSFLDLSTYLHEELMSNNSGDDLRQLLDLILDEVDQSSLWGTEKASKIYTRDCLLLSYGEVLYFSHSMIHHIQTSILPRLVDAYAIDHAKQTMNTFTTSTRGKGYGSDSEQLPGKSKSRLKKSSRSIDLRDHKLVKAVNNDQDKKATKRDKKRSKKKKATFLEVENEWSSIQAANLVPLTTVVKRIAEEYPDLKDIQESYGVIAKDKSNVGAFQWTVHTQDGDETDEGGGPLYEFCRKALYTSKFKENCSDANQAELDKVMKAKKGSSVGFRKQGATKVRSIESSFEDKSCFATACYLVQMLAKLPKSLSNNNVDNDGIVSILERDFLNGCGTNFAKRITEYCLFKHEVEDEIFRFDATTSNVQSDSDESDLFYMPVDTSRRSFQNTYLSCTPSDDQQIQDPLAVLRDVLPGNVGVSLARMWILTGGENYDGGTKQTETGTELIRPGNFGAFLAHVKESCLSMCGIPFKLIDKKSEKILMFARRKELTGLLEEASNPKDILELTVILFSQKVKGMLVCGNTLSGPISSVLVTDKKVPEALTNKLFEAISAIHRGYIPDDLLGFIKSLGLSKDIT